MQSTTSNGRAVNDCWKQIGVEGDRTCPELKTVIHCRNCPVYSAAGRSLLEREPPLEYVNDWTNILAKTQSDHSVSQTSTAVSPLAQTLSVMIFRLGGEWLALPVHLFQEVTQPCVIHTIPHRSNELLRGLVNIRGEILMCIYLGNLLDLETIADSLHLNSAISKRMVVVARDEEKWVFTVDEVCGVHKFQLDELQAAPVVISKATEVYTKGVIRWQGQKVNFLDSDSIFYTLNQRIM